MMLQKGWKCIKCAVCEGCGKCDNESVLILCDDCNIAYHTYCVEPKLDGVPEGSWKCKWSANFFKLKFCLKLNNLHYGLFNRCAHCLTCGANEPGVNSVWLKNYTECGPCASRVRCPSCHLSYSEGDLIIKCENCERYEISKYGNHFISFAHRIQLLMNFQVVAWCLRSNSNRIGCGKMCH